MFAGGGAHVHDRVLPGDLVLPVLQRVLDEVDFAHRDAQAFIDVVVHAAGTTARTQQHHGGRLPETTRPACHRRTSTR